MNSSDLNDIPSVRLASGVEMQQRWPSLVHSEQQQQQQQQQKNGEAPRLIEIAPTRGNQGTVITVVVQSLPRQLVPIKLAFNSLVVDTKQMQAQGITSLVAAVPPFQQTHSATANVPISICMLDKDSVTETWPVAEFVYEFEKDTSTNSTTTPTMTSASTTSSTEPSIEYAATEKRDEIQTNEYQPRGENFLGGSSPAAYESFYQQPVNNYNNMSNQQMPQYSYPYNNTNRDVYNDNKYNAYRPNSGGRATNNTAQQLPMNYNNNASTINLFNPDNTGFTGMLTGFDQNDSTAMPAAIPQQAGPIAYAPQQQQQPQPQPRQQVAAPQQQQRQTNSSAYGYGKSSVHVPSTSVANYQPYPGLVSRANLKIMGDLDSMAKNWAPEEWEHRRRLVQFWREQNGNEIRCTFDPVAQGERITTNSGHIVVSCIYWAERNDCFITSVDCIHLLESLMDIRFSVEEKNRVRRNLEGFRPLTVSKCKAESADFFKLIMSFPNPKPRNIEKDVKVFPWKTLPYALKKIVTKYTASSYNSTGGAQQQRRTQLAKSATTTPAATPPAATPPASNAPSYMNSPVATQQQQNIQHDNNMNNFYQPQPNLYQPQPQQQFNAYQLQQQQQQKEQMPVTSSMYQTSSSDPAYSSSYTQPQQQQVASPSADNNNNTPSPRLHYPYNDMNNNNNATTSPEATATSNQESSPSLTRRASLDNQQDYLVNFKPE